MEHRWQRPSQYRRGDSCRAPGTSDRERTPQAAPRRPLATGQSGQRRGDSRERVPVATDGRAIAEQSINATDGPLRDISPALGQVLGHLLLGLHDAVRVPKVVEDSPYTRDIEREFPRRRDELNERTFERVPHGQLVE